MLVYDSDIDAHSSDEIHEAAMHFESTLGSHRVCLIDTPGVNNAKDARHYQITADAIKANNYNMVLFISNGQYNGTNDERRLLELLHDSTKKPILFVLNQLDCFKPLEDDIGEMINGYKQELASIGFQDSKIFPLSARYAHLLRIEGVLDEEEADELDLLRKRFSKPYLDLQSYIGELSRSEIEKSGIISLEKAIEKQLKL